MTTDALDADTVARIEKYTDDLIASWPPLTEEQKELIARILGGSRLRGGGGNEAT